MEETQQFTTEKKSRWWLWLVIILVIIGLAIAVYFIFFSKTMVSSLDRENKAEAPAGSYLVKTEKSPEGETTNCKDNEGYDVTNSGVTSFSKSGSSAGVSYSYEDTCDFTNSVGGLLREGYCDKGLFKYDLVNCGGGYVCRGGKCLAGDESMSRCIDSDGGNNAIQKGKISAVDGSGEDTCYMNGVNMADCSGAGCKVYEYYCNGDVKSTEEIACQNGCRDGACL